MSSIGTGYDLSATTFSPDGRVFQVEYAAKAVENSGTAIALRVKDGVVFGVEKLILSKLYEPSSNRRIFTVDRHVGVAIAGLVADARQVVNRAREESANYRSFYNSPIPSQVLSQRLAGFVQVYTLYGAVRPFGCTALVGSYDSDGAHLHMIEPSGVCWGYHGCATGKGKQAAKTEIEKLNMSEMTCREAVFAIAKIIHSIHDEVKDKQFELEMSWVGAHSNGRHELVPKDLITEAAEAAKAALAAEEED
ncbi:proteasome subunit alpha type-3 [Capsaspora owczarzaki ATCC 30864]|uniref:Proteasome subunit alpha type n=1 Tax=Capsaspora owczarzaki (strain ATCC 30864) TaxID=595528 RepID=A0A0D2WW71_CAPO3|nr:proteasome subunit alpha type-3 [Capsaspora owczarzaki ATCC 30864]KJE97190.1 proteasome subunit alpha type-3 [Capsaspora owczarzaki ATCC 30864]|eukprot:XP_004343511.1 proteasome subunit alpha type-3 [Capsaspora owczarzaki ATCC 30864]